MLSISNSLYDAWYINVWDFLMNFLRLIPQRASFQTNDDNKDDSVGMRNMGAVYTSYWSSLFRFIRCNLSILQYRSQFYTQNNRPILVALLNVFTLPWVNVLNWKNSIMFKILVCKLAFFHFHILFSIMICFMTFGFISLFSMTLITLILH